MTEAEKMLAPFRLEAMFVERVWGRHNLAPWYPRTFTAPVGEVWLTGEHCVVASGPHAGKQLKRSRQRLSRASARQRFTGFSLVGEVSLSQREAICAGAS